MSIFNLTQIANYLTPLTTPQECSPSPLQLAAASIVMIIAIPTIIKLAITSSQIPPKPSTIHKWIIDGREINFIKNKDQALEIRVTNKTDNTVAQRVANLNSFLVGIPPTLQIQTLINDREPYGWDKNGIPKFIKIKPEVLHTWILDNEKITLTSFDKKLRWKSSRERATHWSSDLPASQKDQLLAQQPLKWNEKTASPDLTLTSKNPPRWKIENKDISLVERNGELTWELNNPLLKTTSWYPIDPTLFSRLSKEDRIQRLLFQNLEPDSIIHDTVIEKLSYRLSYIKLGHFDGSLVCDHGNWAITLLNAGGEYNYTDSSTWGGHAKIILEGIEYARPFTIAVDFLPSKANKNLGFVRVVECRPRSTIDYIGKSQTTLITHEAALKMLNAAYLEKAQNQTNPLPFNKRGINALLSLRPAHNCATWALHKLSLAGIYFPPDWVARFFALPSRLVPT